MAPEDHVGLSGYIVVRTKATAIADGEFGAAKFWSDWTLSRNRFMQIRNRCLAAVARLDEQMRNEA